MNAQMLTRMGDHLDGIDEVREINGVGFNKIDKDRWPSVRGNAIMMRRLLRKYERQLKANYGDDGWELAGFIDADFQAEVAQEKEAPFQRIRFSGMGNKLVSKLESNTRVARDLFDKYKTLHREMGFRFNWDDQTWECSGQKLVDVDIETMLRELKAFGFEVIDTTDPEFWSQAQQVASSGTTPRRGQEQITIDMLDDGRFAINFPYEDNLVNLFNNRAGRLSGITEYNPTSHARETFDLTLVDEAIEKMADIKPDWPIVQSAKVDEYRKQWLSEQEELRKPIPEVQNILAEGMELFPFQNKAVKFFQQTDGRALLGDEMGLGKTLQTLAWLAAYGHRAVVVCPKVVRRAWLREAEKFFPGYFHGQTMELDPKLAGEWNKAMKKGQLGMHPLTDMKLVTINYESFGKFERFLNDDQFDTIVIDESHRMKDPKAKATKTIQEMAPRFKHRILLSGTAIKNKRTELHTQLQLVDADLFPTKEHLANQTIGGTWNKIQSCYLARTKRVVLPDLPEKICEIAEIENNGLPDWMGGEIGEFMRLKAALARAKAPQTVEFVKEILRSSDSRIVVFTDSVDACIHIQSELGDNMAILHHGQLDFELREQVKDEFEFARSERRVFVTTRQSLAVGANFPLADKVVFNDLPWTPADIRQAEDRCHRATSKNTVNVYWLVAEANDFDQNLTDILKLKYNLSKMVLEGKQVTAAEREWMNTAVNVRELMATLNKKRWA